MPERSRKALRLLPRSRPRTNSRPRTSPTTTTTLSSDSPLLLSRHSDPIPTPLHDPHYLPDPRSRSLESPSPHSHTPVSNSPNPSTQIPENAPHDRRYKRQGGRFEPVLSAAQPSDYEQDHDHNDQTASIDNGLPTCHTSPTSTDLSSISLNHALLSELADLRAEQEAQREAMDRLVAVVSAQTARVEHHLDELRLDNRKVAEPGPARILLGSVVDAVAALLICLVTWCVARPIGGVWRVVKWIRGEKGVRGEERRRCSWRLSGRVDMLHSDPFLASAAKRLSFTTAADLHD